MLAIRDGGRTVSLLALFWFNAFALVPELYLWITAFCGNTKYVRRYDLDCQKENKKKENDWTQDVAVSGPNRLFHDKPCKD